MSSWKKWNWENEPDLPKGNMGKKRIASMAEEDPSLMTGDGTGFYDEVRRYLSVGKVKRMFSLGTEIFAAASPFLEKPTWWNAGKVAFSIGKVMVEDVEVWADDYFGGDEWTEPYSSDFNQTLLHVLQRFPYERIKTTEDNTFVRVCTMPNGVKAGWTYSGRLQTVDRIYVQTDRVDDAKAFIKKTLWEQFKGKSLVMRKNNRVVMTGDEARVIFEIDDAFESKQSARATALATQLKRPLDAHVSRSIMFYGPPGTGKSTMARTIIELMGLRSFRIRIADLGGLDNSTLFEAINIFEPDAVILDDFDRAHGQAQLLETLEFFQQKVKLVITTVNNRKALDDALLRPGRIDILELVDKMDEEVVLHVLGEFKDGFDIVKDWPIAFISEYVKRRTYMSLDEAAESVKELTLRVRDMVGYKDEDNDELKKMTRVIMKAVKVKKKLERQALGKVFDEEDDLEEDEEEDEEDFPLDDDS